MSPRVLALSGGIGGAKLALGLQRILDPGALAVLVNTGDDFEHLGLMICPDIDTTLYTLAGLANPELGWGRRDETWSCMQTLAGIGGETWFRLGDRDLALHLERTRRLKAGESLSAVTAALGARLGVKSLVLPGSDAPIRTRIDTEEGELAFQEYFVRRRCEPRIRAIRFEGAAGARLAPAARAAFGSRDLEAILLCPSNPYLSIDPLLAVPGMRAALRQTGVPVVAVTPLVGGRAIKGPTAKIMAELGVELSAHTVARHYQGLIDGFVLDVADSASAPHFPCAVHLAQTVMHTLEDRERLAREALAFAARLPRRARA